MNRKQLLSTKRLLKAFGTPVLLALLMVLCAACRQPIEILIDDAGVPHVFAATDEDAWYGAGYQAASNRMFQGEMLRRFALGRASEVLGEEALLRDQQARLFNIGQLGEDNMRATQEADPERAQLIDMWRQGMNRRIQEVLDGVTARPWGYRAEQLDFLPELWDESDPYTVLAGANFAMDKTVEFEIAMTIIERLYPSLLESVDVFRPAHGAFSVPPDERPSVASHRRPTTTSNRRMTASASHRAAVESPAAPRALSNELAGLERSLLRWARPTGSNSWAVAGNHTVSGTPLVAGDPHMGMDFFGSPYPLHVDSKEGGGSYAVAGFAFPGTPGIALGHNDHLAWTATSAFADVMDLWKVNRQGTAVQVGDELVPLRVRSEAVLVRGEGLPAGQGHIEVRQYEDVPGFGVMLPPDLLPLPLGDYMTGWTGFRARPARWFMELNRAESLDEFEAAVDRMQEMNYSFVAADTHGIAYRVGVEVPDRTDVTGSRGPWRALDGDDVQSIWNDDRLSDEQLPRSRGADRGWVGTANNDPFGFTADGSFENDPWYYGSFFAPGYRAQRIHSELERLTARGDVALGDMKDLQTDIHSPLADDVLPLLLGAWERRDSDPELSEFTASDDIEDLVGLLTRWDRQMARDSAAALAFQTYLHHLCEDILADDMPLAYDFAIELKPVFLMKLAVLALQGAFGDTAILSESADAVVLRAALRTGTELRERFGAVEEEAFAWGDLKVTRFDHALGFGVPLFDMPSDGGEDTLNVSQNLSFDEEAQVWTTTWVPVERSIARFDAQGRPELWVNYPLTAEAEPEGSLHARQLDDYLEGRYARLLTDRAEIEAVTTRRIELFRE